MRRDAATRKIEALVQRVLDGGNIYLDAVDEIAVFGSYVAGSSAPNDVDVLIQHGDPTGEIHREHVRRMLAHRSYTTPFEQALRGRQRGISIVFNIRDQLERQGGFDLRTIWTRGETIQTARERLEGFKVVPNASSAPRDYTHPLLAGFESRTVLADRQRLVALTDSGTIAVRRIEIDRGPRPTGDGQRRTVVDGYSDSSPRRAAMNAVLAHLERSRVPISYSHGGRVVVRSYEPALYAIVEHGSLRLGNALDAALWHTGRSYCVLNLTGRQPFTVLEIIRTTDTVLADEQPRFP